MNLFPPSFQKWLLCALAAPLAFGQAPHFTVREAIRAEWNRQPPAFTEAQRAALPAADRVRLERTLARIGAPGAPALLPPELANPTPEAWEARAAAARTPRERFDALFFLNRFKRPDALKALDGLPAADAAAWPLHLHLEAQVATARINGGTVSPALQGFLDALAKAGKVDLVRAQAARLRLVMAGKEKALLPAIENTPSAQLSVLDAFIRSRTDLASTQAVHSILKEALGFNLSQLGLAPILPNPKRAAPEVPPPSANFEFVPGWPIWHPNPNSFGALQRLLDCSKSSDQSDWLNIAFAVALNPKYPFVVRSSAFEAIGNSKSPEARGILRAVEITDADWNLFGQILPPLRAIDPKLAEEFRDRHLTNARGPALAACINDFQQAPDPRMIEWLYTTAASDMDFDTQQTLIQSYARWKLPVEDQKAQLRRWLAHPNWSCRYEAYQALLKLDPATPWPAAPKPTPIDDAILQEATRLAERGRPVRLRITFSGKRSVTLKLDPTVAPMNVANLVLLARKHYFDGHLVPRVVPDFVVQMGSPFDTMDGGPGYTVRCEDSPAWYGPGSVGMALAGKDTGGSQFFITTNATPHLTGKYTRMGEVEDLDHDLKVLDDLELGARIVSIRVIGDPPRK